jgi:hypothetical protein
MIDFTPYINKAEMHEISKRIRDIFAEAYGDEVTHLQDQCIDYNGWVITFSGTVEDGEIDISELTFSPAFSEQANQIIYL